MPAKRLLACLLALAALGTGACGGDDDDASPVTVDPADDTTTTEPTTTTTKPTTTTTVDPNDPTAAVQQAFYDQWEATLEILGYPTPDNPLIDKHFVDDAKLTILSTVARYARERTVLKRPENAEDFQPRIVESRMDSDGLATVYECTIDGLVVEDYDTGEVVNDRVSEFEAKNTFRLVEGQWKLADTVDTPAAEPGCDDL